MPMLNQLSGFSYVRSMDAIGLIIAADMDLLLTELSIVLKRLCSHCAKAGGVRKGS